MKRLIFPILILFVSSNLLAQRSEPFIVKAGKRIIDTIPFAERYQYSNFTKGRITLNDGRGYTCLFNLNFITGEMEFIQEKDTLFISEKKDLHSIVIAKDTFYYHNAFLQIIRNDKLKVFISQRIGIMDILKKGAMGTINRSAASESYSYFTPDNNSYNLKIDEDMVLQKTADFYYSLPGKEFIQFNRKTIGKIVPGKDDIIKEYLKTNDIDLRSKVDILKLTDYLCTLLSEK